MIKDGHKAICLTVLLHVEVYYGYFGYVCGSGRLYQSSFNHLKIWWGIINVDKAETMIAGTDAPLAAH